MKQMLNKVPAVTLIFWIIKIMATTVGETAADFLSVNLKLGLTNTSFIMVGLLVVALVFQLRARRYVPARYWTVVVFISVVGTLISDNLVDNLGVSLVTTTIIFAASLVVVFALWYASEKTLSVHSIETTRREIFYWSAILCTFALGTSAGDLIGESLGLGYPLSALLVGGLIALTFLAYRYLHLSAVLALHPDPAAESLPGRLADTARQGGRPGGKHDGYQRYFSDFHRVAGRLFIAAAAAAWYGRRAAGGVAPYPVAFAAQRLCSGQVIPLLRKVFRFG